MKFKRVFVLLLIFAMGLTLVANQNVTDSIQSLDRTEKPTKSYYESYTPHDAIWIQSNQEFADQAAAESWDGNGTEDFPYIITGYYFNQETQPLRIWFTNCYWIFVDNVVDGAGDDIQCGIWIEDTVNGAILDCEFVNRHSGMVLICPKNLTISGNYVHDATLNGIEVMGCMTNCEITDNIIEDVDGFGISVQSMTGGVISGNEISDIGGIGIRSFGGLINSEIKMNQISGLYSEGISIGMATNSEISFNSITAVEDAGIIGVGINSCIIRNNSIYNVTGVGMSLDYCQLSDVYYNEIELCTGIGIEYLGGSNTTLHWNTITDCDSYALWLSDSTEFIEVKFNVFDENGGTCQVFDDGDTNYFGYNYYSDWLTPDANSDNYVDVPYDIDGAAGNSDEWPATTLGYFPDPTETTSTSTTTLTGPDNPDLPMPLLLIGGSVGAIVLVAGLLVLKRR